MPVVDNYAPIRDVAAKAAENIARLAALFHMLDQGATGTIDHACVDSATQIVRWHQQRKPIASWATWTPRP